MATVSQLVERIVAITGEPESKVRQYARQLLDDNVLPKSVGRRIAEVTPHHAVLLLLAVLAAPNVKDATRTANLYEGLRLNGAYIPESAPEHIAAKIQERMDEDLSQAGQTLATMLEVAIGYDGPTRVSSAFTEVCLSWPEIYVDFYDENDGRGLRFVEPGKSANFWQSDKPKKVVIVPPITLIQLAWLFRDDDAMAPRAEHGE